MPRLGAPAIGDKADVVGRRGTRGEIDIELTLGVVAVAVEVALHFNNDLPEMVSMRPRNSPAVILLSSSISSASILKASRRAELFAGSELP